MALEIIPWSFWAEINPKKPSRAVLKGKEGFELSLELSEDKKGNPPLQDRIGTINIITIIFFIVNPLYSEIIKPITNNYN